MSRGETAFFATSFTELLKIRPVFCQTRLSLCPLRLDLPRWSCYNKSTGKRRPGRLKTHDKTRREGEGGAHAHCEPPGQPRPAQHRFV